MTLTLSIYKINTINVSAGLPINQSDVLSKEKDSCEQNDKISKYFKNQDKSPYPNYYAGSYIDTYGELVVMISEDSKNIKDKLKDVSGNDKLKFKVVKHNYNELTDIINTVGNGVEQSLNNKKLGKSVESDIFNDVKGTVLLDDQNKIEVYIKNLNSSKIDKFKDKFKDRDPDIFIFKEAVDAKDEAGTAAPGKSIDDYSAVGNYN